ncbi:MAG: ABC transporter substrate-binding protein [Candidatus Andersenbacteria bacterium]|nr:ABC transporter substrate-binding protein [Candidatus Andersenbacteria bacterium]
MKTKWIIGIIAAVILVIVGIALFDRSPDQAEAGLIKIGVVAPLTGDTAFLGEGVREAMLLAKEQLGDTEYQYELIFEDDQLDPKMTASATNKLIDIDGVDVLVSFSSGSGNVVAPIAERNEIVHLGIASDPNVANGFYNFIHWTPPAEEARVFVEELEKRNISRLGMIVPNQQGAVAVADAVKERLEGTDIEIVNEQTINAGDTDFRTAVNKAKDGNPEIYLLFAFTPELEILGRQMKEAGITTPLTSIEAFELTEERDLFEGYWYVNAAEPTNEFNQAFNSRTGKNQTLGAPNAYDIFNLVVSVTEDEPQRPTPKDIAEGLKDVENFNGALGNLSVGENDIILSPAAVRIIQNGQPVTIK